MYLHVACVLNFVFMLGTDRADTPAVDPTQTKYRTPKRCASLSSTPSAAHTRLSRSAVREEAEVAIEEAMEATEEATETIGAATMINEEAEEATTTATAMVLASIHYNRATLPSSSNNTPLVRSRLKPRPTQPIKRLRWLLGSSTTE